MAGKQKLKKFAEVTSFTNVLEAFSFDDGYLHANAEEKVKIRGRWNIDFFENSYPLFLELACGKGEYTLGLAELYPDRNYVGVDIKGNRIWTGARRALQKGMKNAGFLRTRIEFLEAYFAAKEVAGIWIIFPDPFPRDRDESRRLTSTSFLDRYCKVLQDGSALHLKTDDEDLYQFSLESIGSHPHFAIDENIPDIDQDVRNPELSIMTYYERQHLEDGRIIKYIRARYHK